MVNLSAKHNCESPSRRQYVMACVDDIKKGGAATMNVTSAAAIPSVKHLHDILWYIS